MKILRQGTQHVQFWFVVQSLLKGNKYTCCSRTQFQILWVLHHPMNHTWARNTNAPTPTPNLGESHWHGVCVGVCLLRWWIFFPFFFSKFGIAISTVEPWWLKSILLNYQVKKKNVVLPSATDPSPKIKLKEIRVRNVPNFCQIGWFFFHLFRGKRWKMHPTFVLWVLFLKWSFCKKHPTFVFWVLFTKR